MIGATTGGDKKRLAGGTRSYNRSEIVFGSSGNRRVFCHGKVYIGGEQAERSCERGHSDRHSPCLFSAYWRSPCTLCFIPGRHRATGCGSGSAPCKPPALRSSDGP